MANYVWTINQPTYVTYEIPNLDRLSVSNTGSITTYGTGITTKGAPNMVYVDGVVTSTGGTGIFLGVDSSIFVQKSQKNGADFFGVVQGVERAIKIDLNGNVNNAGNIISPGTAIEAGSSFDLFNQSTGFIWGGQVAISFRGGTVLNMNGGGIGDPDTQTAILGSDASERIENGGIIQGKTALDLKGGNDSYYGFDRLQKVGTVIGLVDLGAGRDTFAGGAANETVIGGEGNDIINGGGGSDTALYLQAVDHVIDLRKTTSQETGEGVDQISNVENISSGLGKDSLIGSNVDNVLDGSGGVDTLAGGKGNDTFHVDNKDDVIVEAEGEGYDTIIASSSYTLVAGVHVDQLLAADGTAAINLAGNELANKIIGNGGDNTINGGRGAGADYVDGGDGIDTVSYEGSEALTLNMWDSHDGNTRQESTGDAKGDKLLNFEAVLMTKFHDVLIDDNSGRILHGNDGADLIRGLGGADLLDGGAGNDTLDGGEGADRLFGGGGIDSVVYTGSDKAVEANLKTGRGKGGEAEGDTYFNMDFDDAPLRTIENVRGSRQGDTLTGDAGQNVLRGDGGNDTLDGGGGTLDTAVFSGAKAEYTISRNVDGLFTVTDSQAGRDGSDTLINMRYAEFKDQVMDLLSWDAAKPGPSKPADPKNWDKVLVGTKAKNVLVGDIGNDKIYGKYGCDVLVGSGGHDAFVFDTKLGTAKTNKRVNLDKIVDYNVVDDTIWLDNAVFRKLGRKGSEAAPAALNKKFFKFAHQKQDKDDYLIYNKTTGVLSYDADGGGKGAAIAVAKLAKNLKMTAADFFVI